MPTLRSDVERELNKHSAETGSNTPDFILAQYLLNCLAAFDLAVNQRDKWHSEKPQPGDGSAFDAIDQVDEARKVKR